MGLCGVSWSFEINGIMRSQFENRIPMKPVLAGVAVLQKICHLHYNYVRGEFLQPPHGTTPSAVNNKINYDTERNS